MRLSYRFRLATRAGCWRATRPLMRVIREDGLATMSAVHDVAHCPRVLDAQLARHGADRPEDELICQSNVTTLSAGVQNETRCANKMRLRFCGSGLGANSLSGARMDGPGRACWRGRSESVTRWRPAATRAGSRKPVAAARPPSPTDGATTRFSSEKHWLFGPVQQTRKRRPG